jgi:hypothetical protein
MQNASSDPAILLVQHNRPTFLHVTLSSSIAADNLSTQLPTLLPSITTEDASQDDNTPTDSLIVYISPGEQPEDLFSQLTKTPLWHGRIGWSFRKKQPPWICESPQLIIGLKTPGNGPQPPFLPL